MVIGDASWRSGEKCEMVGRYCSRCCGKVIEKDFVIGDVFPRCNDCGEKSKWFRKRTDKLAIKVDGQRKRK